MSLRDVRRALGIAAVRRVATPYGEIHTRTLGGGDTVPVVMLHGLAIGGRYMLPLALRLAERGPVHVPDLRGSGRSVKPRRFPAVPELAASLGAWADGMGLATCDVVANSFGCQVATAWAVASPSRVRRLVLVGPTVATRQRGWFRLGAAWLGNAVREPQGLTFLILDDVRRAGLLRTFQAVAEALHDAQEERLPRVQAPTLVVRGDRDPLAPESWCRRVATLIPDARMAAVAGRPHALNYNAPGPTARLVRAFLEADLKTDLEADLKADLAAELEADLEPNPGDRPETGRAATTTL